jgi:nucleotide-binding universal stress UspA family protein
LERKLQELAARYSKQENIPVVPVLLKGNAVDQVVEFAAANKMDCLVISTHGRKGIQHALYGSIAERLNRISHVPVLTIHPAALEIV